jgi:diaminopimelate decarboxylase
MVEDSADAHARAELLRTAAHELGSAYVYDLDAMRLHAERLRMTLAPAAIYYAVKANPLPEVVLALDEVLDGVEVASIGELRYVHEIGVSLDRIIFGGPVRTAHDLDEAVRIGVHAIHLDSVAELDAVRPALVRSHGTRIAVRINTATGVNAPFDNMVGGSSRFGVDEEILVSLSRGGLLDGVDGIHLYSGSQLRRWQSIAGQFGEAARIAETLANSGIAVKYVNLGGGFGVPHKPSDEVLNVPLLAAAFRAAKSTFPAPTQEGEFTFELGRYLTAPFGTLVTTVRAVKVSRGITYALTDCGYNAFIRPMLTSEEHEILPLTPRSRRLRDDDISETVVGGPLCTPTDTFGRVGGWSPRVGEVIAINNAGAYGWSMSPHYFLAHQTVAETVIDGGALRVVRDRVTPTDYMRIGRRAHVV